MHALDGAIHECVPLGPWASWPPQKIFKHILYPLGTKARIVPMSGCVPPTTPFEDLSSDVPWQCTPSKPKFVMAVSQSSGGLRWGSIDLTPNSH